MLTCMKKNLCAFSDARFRLTLSGVFIWNPLLSLLLGMLLHCVVPDSCSWQDPFFTFINLGFSRAVNTVGTSKLVFLL